MTTEENYKTALCNRKSAENWFHLLKEQERMGGNFEMSPCHGKITLMICGQFDAGGKNYWDSPEILGKSICEVIKQDNSVIVKAIERLKLIEKKALLDWEEELVVMLEKVNQAKI